MSVNVKETIGPANSFLHLSRTRLVKDGEQLHIKLGKHEVIVDGQPNGGNVKRIYHPGLLERYWLAVNNNSELYETPVAEFDLDAEKGFGGGQITLGSLFRVDFKPVEDGDLSEVIFDNQEAFTL